MELPTVLVNGVIIGTLFGLLAVALILLHRATGVLNFAQGEMGTFATLVGLSLHDAGVPAIAAALLTLLVAAALGVVLYVVVIKSRAGTSTALSLRTLGLFLLLRGIDERIWGAGSPYSMPRVFPSGTVTIFGDRVSSEQIAAVVFAALATTVIVIVLRTTRLGLLVRGVASDRDTAERLGVNVTLVDLVSWTLSAVVGAVVALFFAEITSLSPQLMDPYLLAGVAAAMLGGLLSIPMAVGGGLILGISQSASSVYINQPEWSTLLVFGILLVGVWVTRFRIAKSVVT